MNMVNINMYVFCGVTQGAESYMITDQSEPPYFRKTVEIQSWWTSLGDYFWLAYGSGIWWCPVTEGSAGSDQADWVRIYPPSSRNLTWLHHDTLHSDANTKEQLPFDTVKWCQSIEERPPDFLIFYIPSPNQHHCVISCWCLNLKWVCMMEGWYPFFIWPTMQTSKKNCRNKIR